MRVIGVIAVGLTLTAAATAASSRPVIRVSSLHPFTVHGVRFRPGEHLRIVVFVKTKTVRRLHASRSGAFTVALPSVQVKVKGCPEYSVVVYGPNGRRAGAKSSQESCGPPPAGP